jgi:hypothetical protein
MNTRSANHHPKCTCRECRPPLATRAPVVTPPQRPLLDRRGTAPQPARPTEAAAPGLCADCLYVCRNPENCPALRTPPPGPSATEITAARNAALDRARLRAEHDTRAARYLALRAQGVLRDAALTQVDAEFSAPALPTTERTTP